MGPERIYQDAGDFIIKTLFYVSLNCNKITWTRVGMFSWLAYNKLMKQSDLLH
jgi:hypothetical protein